MLVAELEKLEEQVFNARWDSVNAETLVAYRYAHLDLIIVYIWG